MEIKETLSKGLKREFDIIIPASEVEKTLTTRLESLGQKVKIPGFRPGKVPLSILKQRYQTEVLGEVLEACVDKGIKQIIKEKGLKPSLKPKVTLKSYEEGKNLDIEVKMEILPTIGDINLDNLSFEKYVVTVPAEVIEGTIENIARKNRETHPLQTLRKTKKGDVVIIDFEGFIEASPIEGGAGQDYSLELGAGSFIPGFEDQLIGHDKGAQVNVTVTFPEQYHDDRYANKPARFSVTIKDIHEASPLVIDAALATKLGFDSVQALREAVEKSIAQNYTTHGFLTTKRHVLDALAERFVFEIPDNMVEMEFDNIWEQLCREVGIDTKNTASNTNKKNSEESKTFESVTGKSEEELKKEYKAIAKRRVRLGLLLAEIGNRNNLTINNQELMNALMAKVKEFPGQEKEAFNFYRNNESAMASLRAPLFEDKVVNFILDQSTITEKRLTPEEMEKLLAVDEEEAEKKIISEAEKSTKPSKKKNPKANNP